MSRVAELENIIYDALIESDHLQNIFEEPPFGWGVKQWYYDNLNNLANEIVSKIVRTDLDDVDRVVLLKERLAKHQITRDGIDRDIKQMEDEIRKLSQSDG